jgi:toxin YoeB
VNVIFVSSAKKDMEYWVKISPATVKKIHELIENIKLTPFTGLGKPEPLKYKKNGYWSRRINEFHRLVYKVDNDDLYIIQCRYHY